MLTAHTNYRDYLKDELAERVRNNPSYSLRAFSKQLGIVPSMMSNVLKGSKNFSSSAAFVVAQKLGLSFQDTEYFCLLVQLESSKKPREKESVLARLKELRPETEARDLSLDLFKSIADPAHATALVLFDLAQKSYSPAKVAVRIGVSQVEAESILTRLERLDLIEKSPNGSYRKVRTEYVLAHSNTPNGALRQFHSKMLQKAIDSLESQHPEEKCVGSETVAFDPSLLPEVNQAIEDCFQKVKRISTGGKFRSEVFHLGIQFFRLTQKNQGSKK